MILKMDNVDKVATPQLNDNQHYALISVIPEEMVQMHTTNHLVYDLRDYNKRPKKNMTSIQKFQDKV